VAGQRRQQQLQEVVAWAERPTDGAGLPQRDLLQAGDIGGVAANSLAIASAREGKSVFTTLAYI
jgi:hypothetical protein